MIKAWNMICFLRENQEIWHILNNDKLKYVNEFKDKFHNKASIAEKHLNFMRDF